MNDWETRSEAELITSASMHNESIYLLTLDYFLCTDNLKVTKNEFGVVSIKTSFYHAQICAAESCIKKDSHGRPCSVHDKEFCYCILTGWRPLIILPLQNGRVKVNSESHRLNDLLGLSNMCACNLNSQQFHWPCVSWSSKLKIPDTFGVGRRRFKLPTFLPLPCTSFLFEMKPWLIFELTSLASYARLCPESRSPLNRAAVVGLNYTQRKARRVN